MSSPQSGTPTPTQRSQQSSSPPFQPPVTTTGSTTATNYPSHDEFYIVLHHIETDLTPPPLIEEANNANISQTLRIFHDWIPAEQYAKRFAEQRRLELGVP